VLSGQGLRGTILLQEHHKDLVFDRLGQRHPAENLSGHHARQRNHAGDGHRIDNGHQRTTQRQIPRLHSHRAARRIDPGNDRCVEGKRHCDHPGMRDPGRNVVELRGRKQGVIEGVTRYVP